MKIRQEAEALDGPILRRIGVGFVLATIVGIVLALILIAGPHGPRHVVERVFGAPAPAAASAPGFDETAQYRNIARPPVDPGARLRTYGWVDRKAGIVRVPVARAFELMSAEAARGGTVQPPPGAGGSAEPATSALPARSAP